MEREIKAVVLAAGKGTRLQSEKFHMPKVLREAAGKPLLQWVLDAIDFIPSEDTILVVGYQREQVIERFPQYPFAIQAEQHGTGHAVACAADMLREFNGTVLVLCGDMPLIRRETYQAFLEAAVKNDLPCTFLSGIIDNPSGFGRILRNADGSFRCVVEDKDATPEQKEIHEVNTGLYAFDAQELLACLRLLKNNNAQGEYYLTDVPAIMQERGGKVEAFCLPLGQQLLGVNTLEDLAHVEAILKAEETT